MVNYKLKLLIVVIIGCLACALYIVIIKRQQSIISGKAHIALQTLKNDSISKQYFESNSGFAFSLLKELVKEKPKDNVVYSPYGASNLLAILLNGASGQTQFEIAKVLHVKPDDISNINSTYQTFSLSTKIAENKVDLSMANAILSDEKIKVSDTFLKNCSKFYDVEYHQFNFEDPSSLSKANLWMQSKSGDDNNESFTPSDLQQNKIFLTDYIKFDGTWSTPFLSEDTQTKDFYIDDNTKRPIFTMHRSGSFSYTFNRNLKYQALRLPYGDERYAMYIILPDDRTGLSRAIDAFSMNEWNNCLRNMKQGHYELSLPKFNSHTNVHFKDALVKLGMKESFQDKAAFDKIYPETNGIDDIIQSCAIKIDEKGTVAKSSSNVAINLAASDDEFIVDHPFLSIIRDDATGNILFMGAIRNPEST